MRDARVPIPGLGWLITLALIVLAAVVGPWLSPWDAEFTDWAHLGEPPSFSSGHWLGTDAIGRDVLTRTLMGARVSLLVGVTAALVACVLGLGYGAVAGYLGGLGERAMMRVLDVLSALPFLLIVVLLLTLFERSWALLLLAIAGYVWIDLARVARAEAAKLREAPYVLAAALQGASGAYLVRAHILPQLLPLSAVYLGLLVPQAVLVESFLGFLGLSVDEPSLGLGGLLAEGAQEMLDAPWVLLPPAMLLSLLLLAVNRLSDGARDALDVRAT
jgi:oligopeptide transport system permease protein